MKEHLNQQSEFLKRVQEKVLENISNESFGVSELAEAMAMSRSNLLRRIKKDSDRSASQFIRDIRLEQSRALLQKGELSVSEVAYAVGFSGVSYYIKCFREQYGYPPGKLNEMQEQGSESETEEIEKRPKRPPYWAWALGSILVVALILVLNQYSSPDLIEREKSIAVLPFLNESSDSANRYFVNGIMESTLGNLQKIEDLRVISRTSSEKYRGSGKSIPEIAEELQVSYLVEGSGQKVGDQVLLHIQLIDAQTDQPIWSEKFNRELQDIFELQNEVARKIASAIEVFISPEALAQIEKRPTENLQAYDLFLQAMDHFHTRTTEGLNQSILLFAEALKEDSEFALAYANTAIAYYLLDLHQLEKQYAEQISHFSDQALLYDPKSDISLISKACYYLQIKEFRLALPHLEKALEYNPNSIAALQMLADFYAFHEPNTAYYLEYALMGMQRNTAGVDSTARSYACVQLSNAFLQNGFFDEALNYADQALALLPTNYFAPHLRTFILFAMEKDYNQTLNRMLALHQQDTNRLDLIQDIAKLHFAQEQYDSAYFYYKKLVDARKLYGLNSYLHENAKIAYVYKLKGMEEEAALLFQEYVDYCNAESSIYQDAFKAVQFAYLGKNDSAMQALNRFAQAEHFQYWFILLRDEPLLKPLRDHPDFDQVFSQIDSRFWEDHELLKKELTDKGLL